MKILDSVYNHMLFVLGRKEEILVQFLCRVGLQFTESVRCVWAVKIFNSTGAFYPQDLSDIWLFVQLGLYNIKTKYDSSD